jgi:transcriptional regulator with XRE-family HTH domain
VPNMSKIYETVGTLIRNAREKKGINQEELARQLKLTRTSVSNFERGRQHIQLHTLYQIAEILEVQIIELLPALELVMNRDETRDANEKHIYIRQMFDREVEEPLS